MRVSRVSDEAREIFVFGVKLRLLGGFWAEKRLEERRFSGSVFTGWYIDRFGHIIHSNRFARSFALANTAIFGERGWGTRIWPLRAALFSPLLKAVISLCAFLRIKLQTAGENLWRMVIAILFPITPNA